MRGEGPPAARAVVESTWEEPAAWRGVYAAVVSVNVKGGTGAGRRRVRELAGWVCRCPDIEVFEVVGGSGWRGRFRRQPGHRYSCSVCGARRPGDREGV